MITLFNLRRDFISFFQKREYKNPFGKSKGGNIIPPKDSNLFFVNAGIIHIAPLLKKSNNDKYCSIQKCLRISGKHSDLQEIGHSKRHHTSFEMAGHFAIGALFNPYKVIRDALDFLNSQNLQDQNLSISFHPDHKSIISILDQFNLKKWEDNSNIWQSGEFGDKGFCVEIYYEPLEVKNNTVGSNKIEVWNCVFAELTFNKSLGSWENLKYPYFDSGMGISRLVSILNKNFDTYENEDINFLKREFDKMFLANNEEELEIVTRKLADYFRTLVVMFNDKILPTARGRGYVYRKILRELLILIMSYNIWLKERKIKFLFLKVSRFWEMRHNDVELFLNIMMKEYLHFRKHWNLWQQQVEESLPLDLEKTSKLYGEKGIPWGIIAEYLPEDFDDFNFWKRMKR